VSEVANTICGQRAPTFRARLRDLGTECGPPASAPTSAVAPGRRSVVIPINWRSHSAKLVVALK